MRIVDTRHEFSNQTRSEQGTKIKDTFMTINQTAKKLGVSLYDYVYGREFKLPSLADLIIQKTQGVRLDTGPSLGFKVDTALVLTAQRSDTQTSRILN